MQASARLSHRQPVRAGAGASGPVNPWVCTGRHASTHMLPHCRPPLLLPQAPAAARGRRPLRVRAQAATTSAPPRPKNALLVGLVEALFKFPPFFSLAAKNVSRCCRRGGWAAHGCLGAPAPPQLRCHCVSCLPARLPHPQARQMIVKRGEKMGMDFQAEIDALRSVDWDAELAAVEDESVVYPAYYKVPFHAYAEGNLGWSPGARGAAPAGRTCRLLLHPGRRAPPRLPATPAASCCALGAGAACR